MGLIILILLITPLSCKKLDRLEIELKTFRENAILSLNDGINLLENESADWQFVLQKISNDLNDNIQDALTYDIPYIINIASQRATSSVLCIKENVKDEVLYYLRVAKSELLTGLIVPLPQTKICLTSLPVLDLNAPRAIRNNVIYTGIFIHTVDSLRAALINVANNTSKEINPLALGFPDISNITLSLGDFTDEELSEYTHLQLYYNDTDISTISIEKKVIIPNEPEIDNTNTKSIVYIPPLVSGSSDFRGILQMRCHLELKHNGIRAFARVWLQALGGFGSLAQGWSQWVEIYTVRDGYKIIMFDDPINYTDILKSSSGEHYIDDNHRDFIMETIVGRATLVGDTSGSEAGTETKITLDLKSFLLKIQKL